MTTTVLRSFGIEIIPTYNVINVCPLNYLFVNGQWNGKAFYLFC